MYKQKKISVVQTLTSTPWNLDVRGIQHPKPDKYFFYQDKLPTMKYSTEPNTIWDQGLFTTELFSDDNSDAGGGKKKCTEQAPIPTPGSNERVVHFEFGSQPYTKPIPLTVWWARCCAERLEPVVGGLRINACVCPSPVVLWVDADMP